MKKVLSIAGSDCSGGAGIQADLKTFSAHGVFEMSVIVSVVAENTSRVIDIQDITPDMVKKQIDAVFEDIGSDAVKIGMLSSPECMEAVAERMEYYKPHNIVIDPVMYAKNGCPLMDMEAINTLIQRIIPLADVLTPNIPEAEKIVGMEILTVKDMETAAGKICDMGAKTVVVKGGHAVGNALDVLFDGNKFYYFETARIDTKNTHGTGCTFSSAIASGLAKGLDVQEAVQAQNDGADYLGVGAMFPTKTKKDAKLVSMSELCVIRRAVQIPIVVIGGIHKGNAAEFAKLGVNGLAVVSAIIAQSDIRQAAAELKYAFCNGRCIG